MYNAYNASAVFRVSRYAGTPKSKTLFSIKIPSPGKISAALVTGEILYRDAQPPPSGSSREARGRRICF